WSGLSPRTWERWPGPSPWPWISSSGISGPAHARAAPRAVQKRRTVHHRGKRRLGIRILRRNGPAIGDALARREPDQPGNRSVRISLLLLDSKKAGVAEHPQALDHVGLLVKERPGLAGLTFK